MNGTAAKEKICGRSEANAVHFNIRQGNMFGYLFELVKSYELWERNFGWLFVPLEFIGKYFRWNFWWGSFRWKTGKGEERAKIRRRNFSLISVWESTIKPAKSLGKMGGAVSTEFRPRFRITENCEGLDWFMMNVATCQWSEDPVKRRHNSIIQMLQGQACRCRVLELPNSIFR